MTQPTKKELLEIATKYARAHEQATLNQIRIEDAMMFMAAQIQKLSHTPAREEGDEEAAEKYASLTWRKDIVPETSSAVCTNDRWIDAKDDFLSGCTHARASQAERIKELEKEVETWKARSEINGKRGFEFQEQRDQYKSALEEITKKEPMKVSREEAADMACEFSLVAQASQAEMVKELESELKQLISDHATRKHYCRSVESERDQYQIALEEIAKGKPGIINAYVCVDGTKYESDIARAALKKGST